MNKNKITGDEQPKTQSILKIQEQEVSFTLLDKLHRIIQEEKQEVWEVCDGVKLFGTDTAFKWGQALTSIINVLTENKDKDILTLGLISNIYTTVIYNKSTEKAYCEEILREDTRAVKEIQEFLSQVGKNNREYLDGKKWMQEKTGMNVTAEHSIGKIIQEIKYNEELQKDLLDEKQRNNVIFGTIESQFLLKLSSSNQQSLSTAQQTGLVNIQKQQDFEVIEMINNYLKEWFETNASDSLLSMLYKKDQENQDEDQSDSEIDDLERDRYADLEITHTYGKDTFVKDSKDNLNMDSTNTLENMKSIKFADESNVTSNDTSKNNSIIKGSKSLKKSIKVSNPSMEKLSNNSIVNQENKDSFTANQTNQTNKSIKKSKKAERNKSKKIQVDINIGLNNLPEIKFNNDDQGQLDMAQETVSFDVIYWTKKKHEQIKERKQKNGIRAKLRTLNKKDSDEEDNMFMDDDNHSISSFGLVSLDSNTFDMGQRQAEKDNGCKNVIYTNIMAINQKNPQQNIMLNKKLTDFKIPITYVNNSICAKCIGNFVLDRGNILVEMGWQAHVIKIIGQKHRQCKVADTVPIVHILENTKEITVWGAYVRSAACGNVITYLKEELKQFKFLDKMDEQVNRNLSPRNQRSPKNLQVVPSFFGLSLPQKEDIKALMQGLDTSHDPVDICKGVLEGICFTIYQVISDIAKEQEENKSDGDNHSKLVVTGAFSYSLTLNQFLSNILQCDILKHNSLPKISLKAYNEIEMNPQADIMGVNFCCLLKSNRLKFRDLRAIVLGKDPEMQALNIKKQWTEIHQDIYFNNSQRLIEWDSILRFAENIQDLDDPEFNNFVFNDKL